MKPYKVELQMFCDDATGDYGFAHSNSIDKGFNSFWNAQGIMHDVFEHYFEHNHKYFQEDYGFNIGGEVAAMGHLAYYWSNYHLNERRINPNSIYSFEDNIMRTTLSEMQESITYGYCNFGNILECRVPRTFIENCNLEYIIQDHWDAIKKTNPRKELHDSHEDMLIRSNYKKSITYSKLRNLYSWGWKQAEKIAPYSSENRETFIEFLKFWGRFTKNNEAKNHKDIINKAIFTIYPGEKLKWKCIFITTDNEKINCFDYEDIYSY